MKLLFDLLPQASCRSIPDPMRASTSLAMKPDARIVPLRSAPELDRCIANLEALPMRLNSRKKDAVGPRQLALAKASYQAGLLSKPGWDALKRFRSPSGAL
jgi:hypothetical protein